MSYYDKSKQSFYIDGEEYDFGTGRRCGAMCFVCTCQDNLFIFDPLIINNLKPKKMKTTRGKFNLTVTKNEDGTTFVAGTAVASGSEENKAFSEATPAGNISFAIAKGAPAQENFPEAGTKEYYIDITECPAAAEIVETHDQTKEE